MINISTYIKEAFKLTADTKINKISEYHYQPKTKKELKELVKKLIEERGYDADLNDIDTSEITDMSYLFYESKFNGDISDWDVSMLRIWDICLRNLHSMEIYLNGMLAMLLI